VNLQATMQLEFHQLNRLLERSLRCSPQESALEQGWLLVEMEQRFGYSLQELAPVVGEKLPLLIDGTVRWRDGLGAAPFDSTALRIATEWAVLLPAAFRAQPCWEVELLMASQLPLRKAQFC
jgi:hypothetical protein